MNAENYLGITGRTAVDHPLEGVKTETVGDDVIIRHDTWCIKVRCLDPADGRPRVRAFVPPELWDRVPRKVLGGGGPNSCLAIHAEQPDLGIRFLDAGCDDPEVRRLLAEATVEPAFLGFRKIPHNLILPYNGDRLILKEPAPKDNGRQAINEEKLGWLLECGSVLAQSVADRPLMARLADAAAHDRIRLYTVLTPYLPADYFFEGVIPWASAIFVSIDEASRVLGVAFEPTAAGGLAALRLIAETMWRGVAFVTLGAEGALVTEAGQEAAWHVRLKDPMWSEVQNLVKARPTCVCGAGDAFAGAAFAYLAAGRSRLRVAGLGLPRGLCAALVGCAGALRWIGYEREMGMASFDVREV